LVRATCGDGIIGGGTHGANIFGEVQLVMVAFIVGALIMLIYLVGATRGGGISGGIAQYKSRRISLLLLSKKSEHKHI
jgi:hypothetical protein